MTILEEARPDDLPQLCELLGILFEQELEFHPDAQKQETALRLLVGNPQRGRIFVARADGLLLGMVSVQILVSTALGGDVLLLEDLVVRPAHRGCGYGSALLAEVIAFAQHDGYRRITLLTDIVNRHAQRFYRRHGFRASDMQPYRLLL
jgi:ribosomal protein S18 acetylase RimI-like enzyme